MPFTAKRAGTWLVLAIALFARAGWGLELGDTGLFERLTINSAGYEREFRVLVPSNYRPNRPIGVLLGYQSVGDPTLEILLNYNMERYAEPDYLMMVSIPVRESQTTYNHAIGIENNVDVRCTLDILDLLKTHYQIDLDRIYAYGFSNGAFFSITLAGSVPDLLAAVGPTAGGSGIYSAVTGFACIGSGGTTDQWDTANGMRKIRDVFLERNMEGDLYVYNMGHTTPAADTYVSPPKIWKEKVMDYFHRHPRHFQTELHAPFALTAPFRDDFDSTATRPDSRRWRVEYFDTGGILGDLSGCVFAQADGKLRTEIIPRVPTSQSGGVCVSNFIGGDFTWRSSFTINYSDSGLTLWPVVMSDMTGKILCLKLSNAGWSWRTYPTHLAFRANHRVELLTSGPETLSVGQPYTIEVTRDEGVTWRILDGAQQVVLSGELDPQYCLSGPVEVGFGLRTVTGVVSYDFAEISSDNLNAVRDWTMY